MKMATIKKLKEFGEKIKIYRKTYVKKEYSDVDESATRLMVNHFLSRVLGYEELTEIKTEYQIRGSYADYVIQVDRKKHLVVEVKSIQLDLNDNHLRQSVGYAANEGIDWALLTNGRQLRCYKIEFTKPVKARLLFDVSFDDLRDVKSNLAQLYLLTKKSIVKNEIQTFWKKFVSLEPKSLIDLVYSQKVISYLKKSLKKTTGIKFTEDDIQQALARVITEENTIKLKFKKLKEK